MPDNRMLQLILNRLEKLDQKVDKGFESMDKRFNKIGVQTVHL